MHVSFEKCVIHIPVQICKFIFSFNIYNFRLNDSLNEILFMFWNMNLQL
jgi:hypothetical protein